MGKSHKKRKRQRKETASNPKGSDGTNENNPLYEQQQTFLNSIPKKERNAFFSDTLDPERRAELWMQQADVGEKLINNYSWATPDARCLRILKHLSPIIEIGCGANAYWSHFMSNAGIDVVAFDVDPQAGGTFESNGKKKKQKQPSSTAGFAVQKGGPEVLQRETERTLFLCYPDEDEQVEVSVGETAEPLSMGAACLEYYRGDFVIHVGEIFGDTLSVEQAPWGRSSSPEFQDRLVSEYHCILKANLSNWLHVRDTISVWKRTKTCPIVFAADDDDDKDEEVEYRYIPSEEQLPADVAAPCLAHLLKGESIGSTKASVATDSESIKRKKGHVLEKKQNGSSEEVVGDIPLGASNEEYTCPW